MPMVIIENFFSLIVMGVMLYGGIAIFPTLLFFLLCLTSGIAYLVFRFRHVGQRPYLVVFRRALTVLGIVLAVLALPGFFLACRGRMNEICLFITAPFLGGSVIVLAMALLLFAVEVFWRRDHTLAEQPTVSSAKPRQ